MHKVIVLIYNLLLRPVVLRVSTNYLQSTITKLRPVMFEIKSIY